jgi:cytochrome c553
VRLLLLVAALFGAATTVAMQQAAAQEGDPRAGRRLAGGMCAACHGNDGIATQPDAPNLAGQNALYTAMQLRAYRDGARRHEQMNVVVRSLTDAQIDDLAAWYAAIAVQVTLPPR